MVKYLTKKQNMYWFRRRIESFGEIVFSLKTKNYDIALIRHSFIDYKIKKLLHKGTFNIMTVKEIRNIIEKYKTFMIEEEYNDFEDTRDKELTITLNGKKYGGHTYQALEQEIQRYQTLHEQNDIELIKQETAKVLSRSNLQEEFSKLTTEKDINIFHWELFKAEWELLNKSFKEQKEVVQTTEEKTKQNDKIIETYFKLIEEKFENENKQQNTSSSQSIRISELLLKYINEKNDTNDWSDKNVRDLQYVLGHLANWYDDRYITDLSREDFSSFRDNVIKFLPVTSSCNIFKDKSTKEIIEIVKKEKLKTLGKVTMNKHLRRIHQVFEWASNNGFLEKNLTKDLKFKESKKAKKQKTAKLPYTDEELKLIFEKSPWYTTEISQILKYNPENIFIPLLCLFTGAKPTELAMLHTKDIKTIDGVIGIQFNDYIKNHYNLRFTPLSQTLLDIGFLDYVKYQKKQKQKQLFPSVKLYSGGGTKFTNDYTKFNREFITQEKDKSFYSLRHLVNQKLKNVKTQVYIINDIMGHSDGYGNKDISVYGDEQMPNDILRDTINECLVYDLDFNHIKNAIKTKYK